MTNLRVTGYSLSPVLEEKLAMSRLLLNIEKRSLLRLMLSSDGLASKDAV